MRQGTNTSELESVTQILPCIQLLQVLSQGTAEAAPLQLPKLRPQTGQRKEAAHCEEASCSSDYWPSLPSLSCNWLWKIHFWKLRTLNFSSFLPQKYINQTQKCAWRNGLQGPKQGNYWHLSLLQGPWKEDPQRPLAKAYRVELELSEEEIAGL